jgi:ribosomal-protein-alanine N-acetyltransferase
MTLDKHNKVLTKRLTLCVLTTNDANLIFKLRSSKEVTKYIARPLYKTIEEANGFINDRIKDLKNNVSIMWTICIKESLEPVGTICLWNFSEDKKQAEVGYDLLPEHQDKGYMSEALKTVLDVGFNTINLKTIEAFTHQDNLSSIKLLEKNGFKLEEGRVDDELPDNIIFSIKK